MTYNIFPIPHEVRGLEYLNLLHAHTEGVDAEGNTFTIGGYSWNKIFFASPEHRERRIVHVHWETNIYGSRFVLLSIMRMIVRFPCLWLLKKRGVKIFWTMHNLSAHDYPHPRIDALGKMLMWRLVDAVNIQEKSVAEKLAALHPRTKVITIPQGNYVGIYGPLWEGDRSQLRKLYGFEENDSVLLSLGSIRPYKALMPLMEAVTHARERGAQVKLLIMGKSSAEYAPVISALAADNPGVDLRIGFVPDEKIPEVLAVADYSVFYYEDSSLSSAAMILSLSYGTPVITRDIPASAMIVPGVSGYVFHDASELEAMLIKLSSKPKLDRSAIIGTVEKQDWPRVGASLRAAYRNLWNTHEEA